MVTCGHSLKSYYPVLENILKTLDHPLVKAETSNVFRISWQPPLRKKRGGNYYDWCRTRRIKFYANTSYSYCCEQVHLIGRELKIIIAIFFLQLKIKRASHLNKERSRIVSIPTHRPNIHNNCLFLMRWLLSPSSPR